MRTKGAYGKLEVQDVQNKVDKNQTKRNMQKHKISSQDQNQTSQLFELNRSNLLFTIDFGIPSYLEQVKGGLIKLMREVLAVILLKGEFPIERRVFI